MANSKPIGVFDSGIGGLTVLDDLIEMFPNEDFIYVADTLNCPYGTRTKEDIENKVSDVANYLLSRDVKAIVIACNTATANSEHLKKITNVPIIGVIEPTANLASLSTKNKKIALLATSATIDSKKYQNLLTGINVYPVKCPEFVEVVENNQFNTDYSYELVKQKLIDLVDKDIDTVILGCTHFGLLSKEINNVFTNAILVSSGFATTKVLKRIMEDSNLMNEYNRTGVVEINTSGSKSDVQNQINWFKKNYVGVNEIKLL